MAKVYYIRKRGKVLGPLSPEEVQKLVKKNELARFDEISEDGRHWSKASDDIALFQPLQALKRAPIPKPEPLATDHDLPTLSDDADQSGDDKLDILDDSNFGEPQAIDDGIVLQWYYAVGEKSVGPITDSELQNLLALGRLTADDRVWYADLPGWCLIQDVPRLAVLASPLAGAATDPRSSPRSGLPLVDETAAKIGRLAWASLLFGILGSTLLPVVGCVVSVVLGHMALRELGRHGAATNKLIVAVAGTVAGYIGLALWTILFFFLILRAQTGA